ncbi:hypothetical protein PG993_008785 [Apiospora rasikravindrae]|uniref:Uncharacterized protein n=1 Tax=Apiospora rasikravindrae TaxID=990691 RepID=A0ABR1SQQ4_9PEZI
MKPTKISDLALVAITAMAGGSLARAIDHNALQTKPLEPKSSMGIEANPFLDLLSGFMSKGLGKIVEQIPGFHPRKGHAKAKLLSLAEENQDSAEPICRPLTQIPEDEPKWECVLADGTKWEITVDTVEVKNPETASKTLPKVVGQ